MLTKISFIVIYAVIYVIEDVAIYAAIYRVGEKVKQKTVIVNKSVKELIGF